MDNFAVGGYGGDTRPHLGSRLHAGYTPMVGGIAARQFLRPWAKIRNL